jgi:hypothetical protein
MPEELSPDQCVEELAKTLPQSTPEEAQRLIEHVRAWALVFYEGEVPLSLVHQINTLEEQNHVPVSRC